MLSGRSAAAATQPADTIARASSRERLYLVSMARLRSHQGASAPARDQPRTWLPFLARRRPPGEGACIIGWHALGITVTRARVTVIESGNGVGGGSAGVVGWV